MVSGANFYQVNHGATVKVDEHSVCRKVTNNHASTRAMFVPTRTAPEWTSFRGNSPAGVAVEDCCADANYDSVLIRMPMDGANNSTGFVDYSSNGWAVGVSGDARKRTAESVYGGASAFFDGTGDFLSIADVSGANGNRITTENFTIEFWFYPTLQNGSRKSMVGKHNYGVYGGPLISYVGTNIQLVATANCSSNNIANSRNIATGITINSWYHLALVRNGNAWTTYINGTQTDTFNSALTNCGNSNWHIGGVNGGQYAYTGYLDDIRVTRGVARYTSNFTPPAQALPVCD